MQAKRTQSSEQLEVPAPRPFSIEIEGNVNSLPNQDFDARADSECVSINNDRLADFQSSSDTQSNKQPQSSPAHANNFNEFFNDQNDQQAQSQYRQPVDDSKKDNQKQVQEPQEKDQKNFFDKMYKKFNPNVEDKEPHDFDTIMQDVWNFLSKPSVLFATFLFCVLVILTLQYNGLQKQLVVLQKEVQSQRSQENGLQGQMNFVRSKLEHVEKVEQDIMVKEENLEKKTESWGEAKGGDHEVHMSPLVPHGIPSFMTGLPPVFGFPMQDIGEKIKQDIAKLRNSMFGENHEHHDSQPSIHFRVGPFSMGDEK